MKKDTVKKQTYQSTTEFKLTPMNPCVAGMDIGSRSVFLCIGFPDCHQEIREYLTFTADLKEMVSWIQQNKDQERGNGIHRRLLDSNL